ncbi:uncharacterized protein BDV14DRAFT_200601 [Aspergillus stella-maris]|uniref:uncharacterized protein n=1 Tax=Aspergillus stella-maris TaxID=1810926 RepID=UPI003CCD8F1C
MFDAAAERLNRLQEDDLGTDRRERVSTVDRAFRETTLEVIENSRRSNIPGTAEQRVALAKQAELAAWANFHRVIGDTGDQENLDPLLNGQSHRLKLNDSQGGRTHSFGPAGRGNTSSTNSSQRIPAFHSGSISASNGASSAGPLTRRPSRAISTGRQAPSGLDPALNRNNFSDQANRSRPFGNPRSSAHRFPSQKNRRPLGNFSQVISSPEEFLAAARGMVSTRQLPKEAPPEPKSQETPMEQSTATALKSVSSTSPSLVPLSEDIVAPNQQTPPTPSGKRKTPGDALPEEPHKKIPPSTGELSEDQRKPDTNSQSSAVNGEHTVPISRPSKAVGILLDFNCATTDNFVDEPGRSPALEELKGLEFMQSSQSQTSISPAASNANRRLDFGGLLPTERDSSEQEVTESATEYSDEEKAAQYKLVIRAICKLLELASLPDIVLRMTGAKKELESKLRSLVKESNLQAPGSPSPGSPELQSVSRSVASLTPSSFDTEGPETVVPAIAHGTPKHSRHSSLSTPSSQSRLRAAAPNFEPGTLTNFRTVSSATSTGSSTSFHSTVTNAQSDTPTPVAAKALAPESRTKTIKAQLAANVRQAVSGSQVPLPGQSENAPKRTDRPRKSHIFGDHLLPGRRVTSSGPKGPGVAPYPQSVLAEAAAPKPSPTTFTLPSSPRPIKITKPDTDSKERETAKNAAQKVNAPQFNSAQGSLCLKPSNVAAPSAPSKTQRSSDRPTSMMESIYAPKPKPTAAQSSTDNKKPPVSKGLEASRFSDPKWL